MVATLILVIGLLFAGFLLFLIEAMIPSFGMMGVLGGVLCITSIVFAFTRLGQFPGFVFLICAPIGAVWFFYKGIELLPKTPFGRGFIVNASDKSTSENKDVSENLVGKVGRTHTMLRPSGIAIIEGERISVLSDGMIVEKDCEIIVTKVVGNTVFVKQWKKGDTV